jgi:hypothetical protein
MKLILCIIAAEAMTQLSCKAEIFDDLREWIKSLSEFTNGLLSCPYCISVWVAAFTMLFYIYWDLFGIYFITFLVIHRVSNFLHDAMSAMLNFKIDQILKRL